MEFFKALPQEPGVYKMFDRESRLLYVGKAKNLRRRLYTYRRAKMGTVSRKTIRLIRLVRDIRYELCGSEKEALLRENELIREAKPELNRAKKAPETYYFIGLTVKEGTLQFRLGMRLTDDQYRFGAFKGHRLVRRSMGALMRVLYLLEHRIPSVFYYPPVLLKNLTPLSYSLPMTDQSILSDTVFDTLLKFLSGESDRFIGESAASCKNLSDDDPFFENVINEDLAALEKFYRRCASRNHEVAEQFKLETSLILQQQLDDYLAKAAFVRG